MLHNEHLRKADELYEILHDMHGNAIHIYVTDGEAIIFGSLHEFVEHVYFGASGIRRYYISEDDLNELYNSPSYKFEELAPLMKRLSSRKTRLESSRQETLEFSHGGKSHTIIFFVEEPDFWFSVNGYDVHYCEDYNEICVYEQNVVHETIYSRKIK